MIPLATTSVTTTRAAYLQFQTVQNTTKWLEGTDYEVVRVEAPNHKEVAIRIAGDGELPSPDELKAALAEDYDREVAVTLQLVPAKDEEWIVKPED